ncbi:hypothetical protein [Streptomyces carpinensis]|uniref:Secreted protein n=1 Tax=Streptomyces carpinensis TaxID=66369 RepID=A0ABV1VXC6_9ACTN|nr:hypothetical protein [Streptomyces carpinensis]
MFRGTAARAMLALLAVILLALPFLAPAPSFASAHTIGHVEAKDRSGTAPAAAAQRAGRVALRDCGSIGSPTGPLRTLERHGTVDSGPEAPERPALKQGSAGTEEADAPGVAHCRTARPSAGRTPAALQVFRC